MRVDYLRQKQYYYWIVARVDNQKVIMGKYDNSDDAYQDGYEKIKGDFKVVKLPTSDMARAVRMLRSVDADEGYDIKDTLKRTKHKINKKRL